MLNAVSIIRIRSSGMRCKNCAIHLTESNGDANQLEVPVILANQPMIAVWIGN